MKGSSRDRSGGKSTEIDLELLGSAVRGSVSGSDSVLLDVLRRNDLYI